MKPDSPSADRSHTFTALESFSPEMRPVAEEIYRIWWWAVGISRSQFLSSILWRLSHSLTNGLAAMLAAATGVAALTAFVSSAWIGAGSLIAAALTGLSAIVSAQERSRAAATAANRYIVVRDEARQLLQVDLIHLDFETARNSLTDLTAKYHQVNQSAELPLALARSFARREIQRVPLKGFRGYELNPSWPEK